jgi:type VI secretion system secreted protein Hcp
MNLKKLSMGILILGVVALTVQVAHAQFKTYLKIKGVSGESSVDSRSTDWTQVGGMPHPSRIASGAAGRSGASTGKAELSDFSIVKNVDKASPKLDLKCTSGEHIPEVTLELRRTGGDKKTFFKIKMTGVKIANIQPVGSGGKKERVTFQYKTLKWERVSLIKKRSNVIKKQKNDKRRDRERQN